MNTSQIGRTNSTLDQSFNMDEPRNETSTRRLDDDEDDMGDNDEDGVDVIQEDRLANEEEQKRENEVEEMICDLTVQSDSYPDIHARVRDVAYQLAVFTEIACKDELSNGVEIKTRVEEMVKSQSDLMKKIPRWSTCLKEVDEEHKDILETLHAKEFNETMSDMLVLVNLNLRVGGATSAITAHSLLINHAHRKTSSILQDLSGRNQSDSTSVQGAAAQHSSSQPSNMSTDAEWNRDRTVINYIKGPPAIPTEKLEQLGVKKIGDISGFTEQQQKELRAFGEAFQAAFETAEPIARKKADSTKWASEISLEEHGSGQDRENCYVVPDIIADEVAVVQPYLLTLLQSLAGIVDSWGVKDDPQRRLYIESSPAKSQKLIDGRLWNRKSPSTTMVQNNHTVPATERWPKRSVDQTFTVATARNIQLLREDLIEIASEIRPDERRSEKPEECLQRGISQILCAAAKHVGVGCNFQGVGLDTKSTGIVLTPSYIKLIQLKLESVGTPDVKLTQYETDCLPLLTQDVFLKRVADTRNVDWWSTKVVYPDTNETCGGLPSGLVLLAQIMTSNRKDLFGPDQSIIDGDMVGFGTWSTIHRTRDDNTDSVIKISRYGGIAAIERECNTLKALGDFPHIIKLKECRQRTFTVSDVTVSVPTITLSPVGLDATYVIGRHPEKRKEIVQKIAIDITKALQFIHQKGKTHNDITPKNLLAKPSRKSDGQYEFFLIDFGLATSISEEVMGFWGTPRYAHRALFGKYPNTRWPTTPQTRFGYDLTGLAFSLADLAIGGKKRPWKHFQPSSSNSGLKDWADKRSETSWNKLNELEFNEEEWKTRCYD